MTKSVLISISCFICTALLAQPSEVPLSNNPSIYQYQPGHARQDEATRIKVYVPVGESTTYCVGRRLILGELDSINFSQCQALDFGNVTVGDSCVSYQNDGELGQDVLCMELCDIDNICTNFEVHFISVGTTPLPFSDDFSYPGPYPSSDFWITDDVFINYTLAERPLSLGVATFDGLNNKGNPYPKGSLFSDELTSKFIDVSGQEHIVFSFFVQPKGQGIKPRTGDSLMLDFRDREGQWIRVWQQEGLPQEFSIGMPSPDFSYQSVELVENFLHSSFQFRFQNRSKNEGLQELWHLEYVRMGNPAESREIFEDIAFTAPALSVLSPYTHMPSSHFEAGEVRSNVVSAFYNFDGVPLAMSDPMVSIYHDNQQLMQRTLIEPVQNWTLAPGHTDYDFLLNDGGSMNVEVLQNALLSIIQPGEDYQVISALDFTRASEIINGDQNNQTETITEFSNYFAYDDGSAESAIIDRGGPGVLSTTLAVEFHTNVEDKLQGVQFLFPHIEGDFSSQLFNMKIWLDSLDDTPEFAQELLKPYYADAFYDTLQGFTTYDLRDTGNNKISLQVPKGKFFIGWEQIDLSGVKIPVGYDINSPEGAKFFYYNVGSGWINVDEAGSLRRGALMVRPIVGNEEVISTPIYEADKPNLVFDVYPNPTNGFVRLDIHSQVLSDWELTIYSLTGNLVHHSSFIPQVDLSRLLPGTYIITAKNSRLGEQVSRKITLMH